MKKQRKQLCRSGHRVRTHQRRSCSTISTSIPTTRLTPDSNQTVTDLVAIMKCYPNMTVQLEGHTDSTGDAESNKELSVDRAEAIKALVVAGAWVVLASPPPAGDKRSQSHPTTPRKAKPGTGAPNSLSPRLNRFPFTRNRTYDKQVSAIAALISGGGTPKQFWLRHPSYLV